VDPTLGLGESSPLLPLRREVAGCEECARTRPVRRRRTALTRQPHGVHAEMQLTREPYGEFAAGTEHALLSTEVCPFASLGAAQAQESTESGCLGASTPTSTPRLRRYRPRHQPSRTGRPARRTRVGSVYPVSVVSLTMTSGSPQRRWEKFVTACDRDRACSAREPLPRLRARRVQRTGISPRRRHILLAGLAYAARQGVPTTTKSA
jgi:hypothetical protein